MQHSTITIQRLNLQCQDQLENTLKVRTMQQIYDQPKNYSIKFAIICQIWLSSSILYWVTGWKQTDRQTQPSAITLPHCMWVVIGKYQQQTRTHCRVVVPVQQLILSVAFAVGWVTEYCVECEVETISFRVQLVSRHTRQSEVIRLVHRQQRSCQFSNKVILFLQLAQYSTHSSILRRLMKIIN